jgi:hypothetical protein
MKKVFKVLGAIFLLLLVLILVLPVLFKDKITEKVKSEINNKVNAKVNFSDVNMSLFSHFPDFTLTINNLSVVGIAPFQGDSLLALKALNVSLDIMSVIKGDQIKIKTILLDHGHIHAIVLKDGKANWDIAKPDADTAKNPNAPPSKFKISLKKFEIKEATIRYDDAAVGMHSLFTGFNHTLIGDFTQDNFTMKTNTTIENTNLVFGGIKYLSKVKAAMVADLDMDMVHSKYVFKKNELTLNELIFDMSGWMAMPGKDIDMDLKFDARKADFKSFLSMVPGFYTKDFKDLKSSGKLAFDGSAKGIYNSKRMPAFTFNLQIENGMFQYPKLPVAASNINVILKVNNPDGNLDHTLVNLSKMHVDMGKEPFDAHFIVKTPISDPDFDAVVKGRINLGNIEQLIPLEKGTTVTGLVQSDIEAAGRMSSIKSKKYEKLNVHGILLVNDLVYKSASMPKGAELIKLDLKFTPEKATLNAMDGKMGASDFHATGVIDNVLEYALKGALLKGTINLTSSYMDVNELIGAPANAANTPAKGTAAPDAAPAKVLEIPSNLDMVIHANIAKLLYEKLMIEKMEGILTINESVLKMENLSMNMLDGKMLTNGSYSSKNLKEPTMGLDLSITGFDIQKTVKAFASVSKIAPIAEHATGTYSTKLKFTGLLNTKMEPVLPSLNGNGNLQTNDIVLTNSPVLNKIGDLVKMEQYKKLALNNVNISYKFTNGRVVVDPFDMKIANIKSTVSGSSGFDQTLDYVMKTEVPNFGVAEKLNMGQKVNVNILIKGTATKPVVSLGAKEMVSGAVDALKGKAKEIIDQKKTEVMDKVNAEKAKAQAEADKARAEAEARARAEAEKAKKDAEDQLKNSAKDKLKGIFGK